MPAARLEPSHVSVTCCHVPGFSDRRVGHDLDGVVGIDVVQAGGQRAVGAQVDVVAAVAVHHAARSREAAGPTCRPRSTRDPEADRERLVALEEGDLLAGLEEAVAGDLLRQAELARHRLRRPIDVADAAALLGVDRVDEGQHRLGRLALGRRRQLRRPASADRCTAFGVSNGKCAIRPGGCATDARAASAAVASQRAKPASKRAAAGSTSASSSVIRAASAASFASSSGVVDDRRRARHARVRDLADLVDVVEEGVEPEELLLRDRVVLVVVAAGALDAEAEEGACRAC